VKDFHDHLAALHTLHQQNLARRYFDSIDQIQQEAQEAPKAAKEMHPLLVRVRRFMSRQLHTLAQVVDPDRTSSTAGAEIEGACQVVDVSAE
jgi:hypothetical protein